MPINNIYYIVGGVILFLVIIIVINHIIYFYKSLRITANNAHVMSKYCKNKKGCSNKKCFFTTRQRFNRQCKFYIKFEIKFNPREIEVTPEQFLAIHEGEHGPIEIFNKKLIRFNSKACNKL